MGKSKGETKKGGKQMKRRLGTASVFAICTGAMFSSGFFLLPGLAAGESGPSVPLVYLLASLLILPAIFSMAELCSAIPRAGGPYLFLKRSMGSQMGIIGAFAKYLQLLLKGAFAFVGVGAYLKLIVDVSIEPVAIGLIILFTALNLFGVKQSSRAEVILVAILLLLLTYFVISGIVELNTEDISLSDQFQPLFPMGIEGLFAGVAMVFVSFGGVGQIASLAEEIKEPSHTVPRGMLIALAVSTVFYFFGTSLMVVLLSSDALYDDQSPVATTAAQFSKLPLPVVVVVIAALAAFTSTGNAAIMSAARYPLALARDNLVWKRLGKLGPKRVPRIAVLLTGIILILLVLAFDVEGIAKLASAFLLFVFLGMCLAVIIFRESRTDEYHPGYRSPLYPWPQIVGIVAYIALIVESGLQAAGMIAGLCLLCILWYRFGVEKQQQPTAAIHSLFARLIGQDQQKQAIGELGIPMLGGMQLARLTERAIVFDMDEDADLEEVIQRAADALSKHLGGDRQEISDHLQQEVSHWQSPLRSNIALSPALLQGIEQPEMVVCRGHIKIGDHSYNGLIVLVDDEDSSDRLLKLLSQLESVVYHSDFPQIWQDAKDERELKDALMHDVKNVQTMTLQVEESGPTAALKSSRLRDADLPEGSVVALLQRDAQTMVPTNDTAFKTGDIITVVANEDAMKELRQRFDNND